MPSHIRLRSNEKAGKLAKQPSRKGINYTIKSLYSGRLDNVKKCVVINLNNNLMKKVQKRVFHLKQFSIRLLTYLGSLITK